MYQGPDPQTINKSFPAHTYELVTCLITGNQKKSILNRYLKKLGFTRETYIQKFPDAPLMSHAARDSYKHAAQTELGRSLRSATITQLNNENKSFQQNRKLAVSNFLNSERSTEYRKNASDRAKNQHQNGQAEYIRKYFQGDFIGSQDQLSRRARMIELQLSSKPEVLKKSKDTYIRNSKLGIHNKETRYKKKQFKDTLLFYQSTYELDFLVYCENNNLLSRIKNSHCFSDANYPYNFYEPDYILDDVYIIEIKSWYIENLQEKRCPGLLKMKEQLVIKNGYKFLYIKDKNYNPLNVFLI
jgi:hypothetical protein